MTLLDRMYRYWPPVLLAGIALVVLGVSGALLAQDVDVELGISESATVGPYEIVLKRYSDGGTPGYDWMAVALELKRDGRSLGVVAPEQRIDRSSGRATAELRRYTTLAEALSFDFAGITPEGAAVIHVSRRPLSLFGWLGAGLCFLGALGTAVSRAGRSERGRAAPECASCGKVLPEPSRFCYLCGLPISSPRASGCS